VTPAPGSQDTRAAAEVVLMTPVRGSQNAHLGPAGRPPPARGAWQREVGALAPTRAAGLGALPPTKTSTHPLQELS
jgi:hypothetical protein